MKNIYKIMIILLFLFFIFYFTHDNKRKIGSNDLDSYLYQLTSMENVPGDQIDKKKYESIIKKTKTRPVINIDGNLSEESYHIIDPDKLRNTLQDLKILKKTEIHDKEIEKEIEKDIEELERIDSRFQNTREDLTRDLRELNIKLPGGYEEITHKELKKKLKHQSEMMKAKKKFKPRKRKEWWVTTRLKRWYESFFNIQKRYYSKEELQRKHFLDYYGRS